MRDIVTEVFNQCYNWVRLCGMERIPPSPSFCITSTLPRSSISTSPASPLVPCASWGFKVRQRRSGKVRCATQGFEVPIMYVGGLDVSIKSIAKVEM